ncbi:hypothetical protein KBC04_03540 [Candidatus Babeliales bacterium]|nr:hypothetical protein [Candidatus Babeliales bacterium]MBP9843875.1 hypothetical protein [Candidatus Babeliales bacterium]
MKNYLSLYKEYNNRYYYMPFSVYTTLYDLYMFITNDYHPDDPKLFTEETKFFNIIYIYNDINNKLAYIGLHHDDENHELFQDDSPELVDYVNETNSCKISVDNFQEFIQNWRQIKKELPAFAIIYRDDKDWVHCQGFQLKEDMEQFIQDAQQIVN